MRKRLRKLNTIADLTFDDKNANRGTDRGRQIVGHSLERYGAGRSVLADRAGKLIAGNKTVEQARAAGMKIRVVPTDGRELVVVQRTDLDMDQDNAARELAIADNRAGELGLEWDADMLALLQEDGARLDFMFDEHELEAIYAQSFKEENSRDEAQVIAEIEKRLKAVQRKWKVQRGQVWEFGDHALMCGDCRSAADVQKLLKGARINVAFTSPPYAKQREYDQASGFKPIPPAKYVAWFRPVSDNVANHLVEDGSWFVNIKPSAVGLDAELYVFDLVLAHARAWDWHFATEFCWERTGVPKHVRSRFKNQFEPIYQFVKGKWKIRPNNVRHASENMIIPFGKGAGQTTWDGKQGNVGFFKPSQLKRKPNSMKGRMNKVQGAACTPGEFVADGWAYPGNRLPPLTGSHEATGHPAAFPVGLPAFFIKAYSDEGDVIYDPFCGSGSTVLGAFENRRRGFGMELSPIFCAISLERFSERGLKPTIRRR
jgi:site-specific DNA-methyltransferase (adenine-specific)/site-specific DNA-methyltransferase (cytosine-N4-specific)